MTPEQLEVAAQILAEIEAKEKAAKAQVPPPPSPPPVVAPADTKPKAQVPPPPPVVNSAAETPAATSDAQRLPTFAELQARVAAGESVFPSAPTPAAAVEMPVPMNPQPTPQQQGSTQITNANMSEVDKAKIEQAAASLFG